jgi:mannose-6-phosphate isomerase-like protein (cupin superfamily)
MTTMPPSTPQQQIPRIPPAPNAAQTGGRPVILHTDAAFRVEPGSQVNYNANNPLVRLMGMIETMEVAAEREHYMMPSLQYLVPYSFLELYGPNAPFTDVLAPQAQDFKTDFQKQNIKDFIATDAHLIRGLVSAGDWTGPFLRISYNGSPNSLLGQRNGGGNLGSSIKCFLRVNGVAAPQLLTVPYNQASDRYELEIWGYPGNDLYNQLDAKGRAAMDRGELIIHTALIHGNLSDFDRDGKDGLYMGDIARTNAMHPLWPLHVELAWANQNESVWDSQDGANYHYEFNMVVRGWDSYLGVGMSPNPHGGVGFLEFRNLMSNYFYPQHPNELGRNLQPWNFNAYGSKDHGNGRENFMAVDYMDLHIMKPNCGIGLHRHRDNQELFFMLYGQGMMVVGDWVKTPERERCFEIRTLREGHFAMLKGGNLHGLMNARDEDAGLFMFGGYD